MNVCVNNKCAKLQYFLFRTNGKSGRKLRRITSKTKIEFIEIKLKVSSLLLWMLPFSVFVNMGLGT